MRAAKKAPSTSALTRTDASGLLFKLAIAVVGTLALLVVWRPTVVHAQASASAPVSAQTATHVVKSGETLWSLAARYYGDGHQWQDLARRNQIDTQGSAPLRVGQKLTVPAKPSVRGANAGQVAAAPADSTVPKVALAKAGEGTLPTPASTKPAAGASGSLAAQTASKGNAAPVPAGERSARPVAPARSASTGANSPVAGSRAAASVTASSEVARAGQDTGRLNLTPARGTIMGEDRATVRVGLVNSGEQAASRKASEALTVFHRDIPDAAEAERRALAAMNPNTPVPRQGEYDAAPFLITDAQRAAAGQIVRRRGASEATGHDAYPTRAIKTDEVELAAGTAGAYTVGQRLVAFSEYRSVDGKTVVAIPAGVLEVTQVEAGRPALAIVRRQSGRIEGGQRVLTASGEPAPRSVAQRLETPDVSTTVRWLERTELLPTLQSYLVLDAGSDKGLKAGDEIALYHQPAGNPAEKLTATVRVVRVDGASSTAIILRQYGHEIATGMAARRFAKAP
ncbi:MAG TPA: LysM peptidoglycan-binding domain-containing protein [Gemmatimonas sp.]|uniref:LysM peptidoglycan-binding domain-containing protein n=1 Tax=Gemmatimonas sp. TaxID=1962908 RepID=UPI002EDB78A5